MLTARRTDGFSYNGLTISGAVASPILFFIAVEALSSGFPGDGGIGEAVGAPCTDNSIRSQFRRIFEV